MGEHLLIVCVLLLVLLLFVSTSTYVVPVTSNDGPGGPGSTGVDEIPTASSTIYSCFGITSDDVDNVCSGQGTCTQDDVSILTITIDNVLTCFYRCVHVNNQIQLL